MRRSDGESLILANREEPSALSDPRLSLGFNTLERDRDRGRKAFLMTSPRCCLPLSPKDTELPGDYVSYSWWG